jgi:hypothetical protein
MHSGLYYEAKNQHQSAELQIDFWFVILAEHSDIHTFAVATTHCHSGE